MKLFGEIFQQILGFSLKFLAWWQFQWCSLFHKFPSLLKHKKFNSFDVIFTLNKGIRFYNYKRILKNGYSSPREIESAYLATDSFKDKDEKGLLFSVVRILDSEAKYKGYGEGIYFNVNLWNKVSEEQKNTLSAFYGSENLEFISSYATSEKTQEQKIKFDSIIANFKEKLRNSL